MLLRLVGEGSGANAVEDLLRQADTTHDAEFLSQPDNWISLDEAISLLETAQHLTGDTLLARRVGEHTVRQHAGTQVATLLRSLGSPEAILANIALAAGKFSTVTEMTTVHTSPGKAVITAQSRPGFVRHELHCQWTAGLVSQVTVLFGLPAAHVHETECQADGGQRCSYTLSWDAQQAAEAADPAQRVTALEAQLIAISERLRGVYETASDLISPDELDVVLARIVERAASTVRAPRYVLAVRTSPAADLRVYCDGLDQQEALAIVTSAELGHGEHEWGAVATVASGRRAYGHLIAEGSRFFPQERELLELYAKHAAAVLDMATALEESAQRHHDVSALLSLSESLAEAATSSDVAARLAETIPRVVDCDHAAVYGWDQEARALLPIAARLHRADGTTAVDSPCIIAADTSLVDDLLGSHQPRFFDAATDDRALSNLMTDRGLEAMAVVPIVARDAFLGALVVAVEDKPQRLTPTTELLERLTGVAALAAPPLQNGRLIDELRRQAGHDPLTGLSNRAGFADHIGRALDAKAAAGSVGLLFVDLDGFKQVNDTHGHHVGDELLRQSARRLTALVRSSDATARLGGDEFAVILEDVGSADELEAAAGRVRDAFADPFVVDDIAVSVSASVGGAIWPEDGKGVEDLMRQADVAMYRQKAGGLLAPT